MVFIDQQTKYILALCSDMPISDRTVKQDNKLDIPVVRLSHIACSPPQSKNVIV